MKTEQFREITGPFLLNEPGDPHFLIHQFKWQIGYNILRFKEKLKNSALRHFYLNAEKKTSLGTAGYVCTRQIL